MEEHLTKKEKRLLRKEAKEKQEEAKNFRKRIRRVFLWVFGTLVVSFIVFKFWGWMKTPSPQVAGAKIEITSNDWVRGENNAGVTLVEYSDFQCPACSFYNGYVDKLLEEDKGKVRLIYREFPLTEVHDNAFLAAKAAEAAGAQGKFWEMHDTLFDKQTEWSNEKDAKSVFISYAKNLELDEKIFSEDLESKKVEEKVNIDIESGKSLNISGTPTFFINGNKFANIKSYEDFKKTVEKYF